MDPITLVTTVVTWEMWAAVIMQTVASVAKLADIGSRLAAGEVITVDQLNAAKAMNDADVAALDAAVDALPPDPPKLG